MTKCFFVPSIMSQSGGRFDFDDGGVYCGAWEDGKAHGQGICTGPKGQGEYAGSWNNGFEVIGVYTWPSGNTYEGNWSSGKRHNLGVEVKGKWEYKGEWTHGYKGRFGVRSNSSSRAKYEGTWLKGLQDGFGRETYADGGTYQGQWLNGMRQGYGIRQSAPYGMATIIRGSWKNSISSLRSEMSNGNFSVSPTQTGQSYSRNGSRSGFVLTRHPMQSPQGAATMKRNRILRSSSTSFGRSFMGGLKKRSRSNVSIASNKSCRSVATNDSFASATSDYNSINESREENSRMNMTEDDIDSNTTETYFGEWKNDSRSGFGVCQQSDGHIYEGEWLDNQRHGYGTTSFPDGSKEEGKYKYNIIASGKNRKSISLRPSSSRSKAKVAHAVERAQKAKETAIQKSEIATARVQQSINKASQAVTVAESAREEAHIARCVARDQDPTFKQPGLEYMKLRGQLFEPKVNIGDTYLTEPDRRDVVGPESYLQYSSKLDMTADHKQSDELETRQRTDLKSPRKMERERSKISDNQEYFGRPSTSLSSSNSMNFNQSPGKSRYLSPNDKSSTQMFHEKAFQSSNFQYSSQYADNYSFNTSTALDGARKKPETSSTNSLNISSAFRSTKKPFQSLRFRSRKTSNSESGLGDSISVVSNDKNFQKPDQSSKLDWTTHSIQSAQDKRKTFQKAYSGSDRAKFSLTRSSDAGSFDFETNQVDYLQNYESEMQRPEDEQKVLKQDALVPATYNQNYTAKLINSAHPSLYTTAERLTIPPNTINDNRFSVVDQCPKNTLKKSRSENDNFDVEQYHSQNNKENRSSNFRVTPLITRDVDETQAPISLPPTPAFANFTGPSFSDEQVSVTPRNDPVNEFISKKNSFNSTNQGLLREDYSYQNNFYSSSNLNNLTNEDHSPLPSKLRKRFQNSSPIFGKIESANDKLETEEGSTYLIVLIFLLIVGFMAIFVQFLT